VDAAERLPNTTPMATYAVAMKGVATIITTAGAQKPLRWPRTMVAADTCEHDGPAMLRPVHEPSGGYASQPVGDSLQREQEADL
jgi:hypothetical protein